MIQVAIVGFGLSGRYLQAPFFVANPLFRLKTVVTRQDPGAVFPGVGRASDIGEVLADPEIDLVSVCSPNDTHFDYAQQCLRAGKHVLVEKPFAAAVAEAEALLALAVQQDRHIFVFQNRRFDSDFLTVQRVIQQGLTGELLRFEAHFDRYKPVLHTKKWKEERVPGNGILYDLGAHLIDQSIALFGVPYRVWGESFAQREGSAIDDAFDIRLDYGHLKVRLSASLLTREPLPRYTLHGTKGSFLKYGIDVQEDHLKAGMRPDDAGFGVEPADQQGFLHTEINGLTLRGKVETLPGNWRQLFQNIADVLLDGHAPLIPTADVLPQLRIMEAIQVAQP
jgi:scyllo-inositol 2-dehydrogenase (NADP+)